MQSLSLNTSTIVDATLQFYPDRGELVYREEIIY